MKGYPRTLLHKLLKSSEYMGAGVFNKELRPEEANRIEWTTSARNFGQMFHHMLTCLC